jgi:hypothetical protein
VSPASLLCRTLLSNFFHFLLTSLHPGRIIATIGKVNNRLLPTQITDTNGNYIQIAYRWESNFPPMAINYIVDTLGRVIQFNYGGWPAPSSTSLNSISTPTGTVTLGYQTVTTNLNFPTDSVIVENAPASFYGVSSVTIPSKPTYQFSYSGYGMIYNISASTFGGTATVTYDYPLGGEEIFLRGIRGQACNLQFTFTGMNPPSMPWQMSKNKCQMKNICNMKLLTFRHKLWKRVAPVTKRLHCKLL